jgi:cytochrome c5
MRGLTITLCAVALLTIGACSDTQDSAGDKSESKRADKSSRERDAGAAELDAATADSAREEAKGPEQSATAAVEADAKPEGSGAEFCSVLQVMQSDCQVCHGSSPVAGAPMPLVSYDDFMKPAVSDPSRKVYELVDQRTHDESRPMPPAGVLPADKLAPLEAWIKGGAAQAQSSCENTSTVMRKAPDDSWPKDCEDIYTVVAHDPDDHSKPYTIPANDEVHPYILVDAPWGDDDVQLLATRPVTDNEQAVHHWILWESKQRINLTFWAPGATGDSFPDDVGLYMPKGKASMALDMHYYNKNNDKPTQDRSGLEMCVTRKHRRAKTATLYGLFGNANVPPKQRVENTTSCTVQGELHLIGVTPHMHHMGRRGFLSLQRGGTGPIEVLHDGPFSFEEQTIKPIEDTLIQAGDVLTTRCTFENSSDRMITFGEDTEDEMCINWVRYYPKGGFTCARMAAASDAPIDPNSTGNGGPFPTGEDQEQDAGVEEPPVN